ncbi:DUF4194 domain-containing protein [Corynebacterium frankenforstense]
MNADLQASSSAGREPDAAREGALYDGDHGTLTGPQRRALVQLIAGPFISQSKAPDLFAVVSANRETFAEHLDNLFLDLVVDDTAGVAFTKVWSEERGVDDRRALLRSWNLTFMDSVVLLHLRDAVMRTGLKERTVVSEEEVFEATSPFQGVIGTDKSSPAKKFTATWNKMNNFSIISKTATPGRFEVSPVLRVVFGTEEIAALTKAYERLLGTTDETEVSESCVEVTDAIGVDEEETDDDRA